MDYTGPDVYLFTLSQSILYPKQAQSVWEAAVHLCQPPQPPSLERGQ